MNKRLVCWLPIGLMLISAPAWAELVVEITKGQADAIPIAIRHKMRLFIGVHSSGLNLNTKFLSNNAGSGGSGRGEARYTAFSID